MNGSGALRRARVMLRWLGKVALVTVCFAAFVSFALIHAGLAAAAAAFMVAWTGTALFFDVTGRPGASLVLAPLLSVGAVAALLFTAVQARQGHGIESLVGLLLTLVLADLAMRRVFGLLPAGSAGRDRLVTMIGGGVFARVVVAAMILAVCVAAAARSL